MHKFLFCAYKSQDFAQSQKIFMWLHDLETVTFRNSGLGKSGFWTNLDGKLRRREGGGGEGGGRGGGR